MEQKQNELRASQGKKNELAGMRAMEKYARHPQLSDHSAELEPTEPPKRGCGDAGLARIVGKGKPKKAMKEEDGGSNGHLEGGARHQGRLLAEHLMKMHGAGFLDDFYGGMKGCGKLTITHGAGDQIAHAPMMPASVGMPGAAAGGQDVPRGAVAPRAYGNVPQAPAAFARNAVGEGRPRGRPRKASRSSSPVPVVVGGARQARGQMISKLMREHGMTLGQASKYLKEHK
jgi:hypothetical protein